MVLHADKLRPPSLFRHELHLRKLRRPHGARTDIPYLPTLDQIVQRLHRLCDGRLGIEAVYLQQIDIRRVKPLERRLDGVEDGCPAEPALVGVVA